MKLAGLLKEGLLLAYSLAVSQQFRLHPELQKKSIVAWGKLWATQSALMTVIPLRKLA